MGFFITIFDKSVVISSSDHDVLVYPVPASGILSGFKLTTFSPTTMGMNQLNGTFRINGASFDMNTIKILLACIIMAGLSIGVCYAAAAFTAWQTWPQDEALQYYAGLIMRGGFCVFLLAATITADWPKR